MHPQSKLKKLTKSLRTLSRRRSKSIRSDDASTRASSFDTRDDLSTPTTPKASIDVSLDPEFSKEEILHNFFRRKSKARRKTNPDSIKDFPIDDGLSRQTTMEESQPEVKFSEPQLERPQQPEQQPLQHPIQRPVQQPVQQPIQRQVQQPVQSPVQQPVQRPVQLPVQRPLQQPIQHPVQQPIQRPVQQPVQRPVQQPVQRPVQQPVQRPVQQPVQRPVQQPVQRPAQRPVEAPRQVKRPVLEDKWSFKEAKKPLAVDTTLRKEQKVVSARPPVTMEDVSDLSDNDVPPPRRPIQTLFRSLSRKVSQPPAVQLVAKDSYAPDVYPAPHVEPAPLTLEAPTILPAPIMRAPPRVRPAPWTCLPPVRAPAPTMYLVSAFA